MPAVVCPACGSVAEPSPAGTCSKCGELIADGEATIAAPSAAETRTRAPDPALAPTLDAGPRPPGPDPRRWSIPGYEVLGELGRGGMGVVYRAREVGLDREVALKVLLSGAHAGPGERARFRAEAEAAAGLRHPHTVQVFRVGEHQGLPFLALELVPGGTLADRLKAGPLAVADAVTLVEKAARAVQVAHAAGIAHRDLKPANILLTAAGEPKVADFGLVRSADSELTASGAVMGTPAYMAPEQARGDTKAVGPGADVWALGAVLAECLTGRPPFQADSPADTIRNVLDREPAAVRRLRPGVPKDLEAVCLKCLEKDPKRRYASAGALADDLARHQRGEAVTARRPPVWSRLGRRAARHRTPITLAAAVLLAAAGTLLALPLLADRSRPPLEPPAGFPADLAAIPPDAIGFVSVHAAALRNHPGVEAVLRDVAGGGAADGPALAEAERSLHEMFGFELSAVERVTLVLTADPAVGAKRRGEPRGLVLLRTDRPVDLARARDGLERMFVAFDRKDRNGRWYLESPAGPDAPAFALFAITDRDVAFGTAEDVRGVIDRVNDGPADGPLAPAVAAAAEGHTAVLAARPTVERVEHLLDGPAPEGVGRDPAVRALAAARQVVATFDLLPPTADHLLPGFDLVARFEFDAEPAAAAAVPAARDLLDHLAALDPGKDPHGWVAVLVPELRTAIAETTFRQTGTEVEIGYRPRWSAATLAAARAHVAEIEAERAYVNRYRQIGLALHNYADTHGHLPPAVVRDEAGRPLRSWRVELLPFLDNVALYKRLKLDEPWDSPHNKPLLAAVPAVFADPGAAGPNTRVQAVVGPGTALGGPKPIRLTDIPDGLSSTLFVLEAADPVFWAEPKDYFHEPGKTLRVGRPGRPTFLAVTGEGDVRLLLKSIPRALFDAAATRAGGELISLDKVTVRPGPRAKR